MSFQADALATIEALLRYGHDSESQRHPAIDQRPMAELIEALDLEKLMATSEFSGERYARFLEGYLSATTRFRHPGNVAHQQAVPHYMAALAGLIDGYVNNDGGTYECGPAAVSIEYFLINWLIERVGWIPSPVPPHAVPGTGHAAGVMVQGGSISNLTAMIAARTRIAPEVWRQGNPHGLVILAPKETHYSIARAAGIMGLGHDAVVPLDIHPTGVILPDRLPAALQHIRDRGQQVMALIANAASTAAGVFDPLEEIAQFCKEAGIWLHVDGAHGGPVILSEKYRQLVKGVEMADSFTLNTHKLLQVSATCTVLLMRNAADLDHAFAQEASYLFFDKDQPGFDFIHRTIECTKPVMGLKLFLVLAAVGESGMARFIDGVFDTTRQIYDYLRKQPDIECPYAPQSNILCFRFKAEVEDQLELRSKLLTRGNFYITTATLDGVRYLRLTITHPETRLDHIQALVTELRTLI